MKIFPTTPRPFIKWVGGKGQLLQQLEQHLPQELYHQDFTYIEPFIGGGAMLFYMLQKFPNIKRVIINDINKNLIQAYSIVKEEPDKLIHRLKDIEQEYFALSTEEQRKDYYLNKRQCFNEASLTRLEKTAFLFFLNRTCFNGLYRENSKGHFNVPFGHYTNPTICNESLILADSEILQLFDVEIISGHYNTITQYLSDELNFIYFDPPYRPLSTTSSFNTYVKEIFNDDSQRELADFCRMLDTRENVKWMLSNSDCSSKNPEDTFFEDIYGGFEISRVYAARMVNANGLKRGKLTELLIRNYSLTEIEARPGTQLKLAL